MKLNVAFLLCLWFGCGYGQRALFRCINLYSKDTCFDLFDPLQRSLLSRERNQFELKQAFFPVGVFSSTSLINVLYTVEFETSSNGSSPALPDPCLGTNLSTSLPIAANSSTRFSVGWSESGVFNILSPIQLSELQLQIVNELYGWIVVPGGGIYLPGKFGWTVRNVTGEPVNISENNMVKLSLSLDLSNLTCIPDADLVMAVLQEITVYLKVYAIDFQSEPPAIEEGYLGFVTAAGVDVNDSVQIYFTPFFPGMFILLNVILGVSALLVSSFFFIKTYKFISYGRRQFGYYFTALAFVAFLVNLTILLADAVKAPEWCNTFHITGNDRSPIRGCDQTVITKLTYQWCMVPSSLIAAAIVFKFFGSQKTKFQITDLPRKIRYTLGFWMIILMLSLCIWGVVPSIMLSFIYPSLVISLSALIFAVLFWTTVIISIPLLFVHNFMKSPNWLGLCQYITHLGSLAMGLLIAAVIKILYITATVFGTTTGMALFVAIGVVPSLLLTVLSEHYRDWFLTRVLSSDSSLDDEHDILNQKDSEGDIENTAAFDIQPVDKNQCGNGGSHENIKLQDRSYKGEQTNPAQTTIVNGIAKEDDMDVLQALADASSTGVAPRRATVGVPTISVNRKPSSETIDPTKLRRGGFRRTNEPRHPVMRRLTQVYYNK